VTARTLRTWLARAQKAAGLPKATGEVHILRHTFCSHLAMRGAPTRAIQELAGHSDLKTTQRYMHLTPAALERDRAARTARAGHSAGDSAVWRQVGDGLSEPDLRRQGFWFQ
jgi:site-specific recombinase XerD